MAKKDTNPLPPKHLKRPSPPPPPPSKKFLAKNMECQEGDKMKKINEILNHLNIYNNGK